MADKFPFFESYYESLRELPPEQFKDVVTAMCEKAFHDNDVTLNGTAKGFYTLIKPIIEKSLELSERRSSTGRLGGRPTKPNRNQTETK